MSRSLPLANCRILVTRPRDQLNELCKLLLEEDAVLLTKPLIEIGPPDDFADFDQALRNLPTYDWVIFASVNAVNAFFSRSHKLDLSLDWGRTRIAAIGSATAAAVAERNLEPDFVPTSFVAETFIAQFPGFPHDVKGSRLLWPKTDIGRTLILDRFAEVGAQVIPVIAYTTRLPADAETLSQELRYLLESHDVDIVTFTSSQTVRNFVALLASVAPDPESVMSKVLVAVIGPETADTARKLLPKVDIVAGEHTIQGLVRAIRRFVETNKLKYTGLPEDN
jgi:uroporphyrinogen-III synthase